MKNMNLRLRLIVFFVLISTAVFLTAGAVSWFECREKIDEFFDTYQINLAKQLSSANWTDASSDAQKISDRLVKKIKNADEDDEAVGFAVFDLNGRRVFHDGENGKDFPALGRTGAFDTEKIDGEKWRVIRMLSTDGNYVVAVGQELDYRAEVIEDMLEEFMLPWCFGLLILLACIIVMLTKEFSPLKAMAKRLKERSPEDLSPLDDAGIPDEVKPLTDAVNGLFLKINDMLQRERRFISDSAHELRSPLTALKVQLEVAEMVSDDSEKLKQSFEKLGQGIDRSARLVEQLLALSRIGALKDRTSEDDSELNWKEIIAQTVSEHEFAAKEKNIAVKTDCSGTAPFEKGNPVWAALLLRNLIDNALKYSPENAKITVSIKDGKLSVCNSDTVVAPDRLEHLCERFYRPAGQTVNGSGLGLAIVSEIAAVYGCKTQCANTDKGFCVTVSK